MKSIFSAILISLILVGCSTPTEKFVDAQKLVDDANKQITSTEKQVEKKGADYTYAADFALSLDPNPNKYSEISKEFTSRAVLSLGNPDINEARILQGIVINLLSTNEQLVAKGALDLKEKDSEIGDLQSDIKDLNLKLQGKEDKLREVSAVNASLATTWQKITRSFHWVLWIVIIGFIISVVGKFLPPPYNSIVGIIAVPLGLFTKLIHGLVPAAKQVAGVVDQSYKSALTDLTLAVQKVKEENPTIHPQISKTIAANVNDTSAAIINSVKTENNITS